MRELRALTRAINPAVGDALSGVLVVEAILRARGWGLDDWDALYRDLPSRQSKVSVRDRAAITTTDAERRATTPEGMQDAIDAAVRMAGSSARAFARPRRVSRSLVDPTSLSFVFLSPPLARGLVGGFGFAFDRDAVQTDR